MRVRWRMSCHESLVLCSKRWSGSLRTEAVARAMQVSDFQAFAGWLWKAACVRDGWRHWYALAEIPLFRPCGSDIHKQAQTHCHRTVNVLPERPHGFTRSAANAEPGGNTSVHLSLSSERCLIRGQSQIWSDRWAFLIQTRSLSVIRPSAVRDLRREAGLRSIRITD